MPSRSHSKSGNGSARRHSAAPVIESERADESIDTGASRVRTSGPGGHLPIALDNAARESGIELLNQLLADTITLRDLYKKHHWQVAGPHFYSLHLLFDKHYEQQAELVDEIAERIRILGGISVAMGGDVARLTRIPQPPFGREPADRQIQRLLEAHEIVLQESHAAARQAAESGDDGTNDLIVSDVIRTNELQAWFIGEHLDRPRGESR